MAVLQAGNQGLDWLIESSQLLYMSFAANNNSTIMPKAKAKQHVANIVAMLEY